MPVTCGKKHQFGRAYCVSECPATAPTGVYSYARVERPADVPPADERTIDVAVLDMNHGWPNLGHDSIVRAIRDTACDVQPWLERSGLNLRAISYDVRRKLMIPEPPNGRFSIYLGTGGPGHIDPGRNDGVSHASQGVREDPSWVSPLFALFDSVRSNPEAVLLAVCHTFGVVCNWSGAGREALRGDEKGGKSSGVMENILTRQALDHPWFERFSRELPDGRRHRVVDNRLFDLLAGPDGLPDWIVPIAYETIGIGGPTGNALTMLEAARDRKGVMPRILASNHHPEIADRELLMALLKEKLESGEVSRDWYEERARVLTGSGDQGENDRLLGLTSYYALAAPLQFHLYRQIRVRAEALNRSAGIHEDQILDRTGPES
ncbi:MAG: hypothetical protein HY650_05815 [Acidobacteria bacterium]|nr:hypothetical protein [Acidobacteriota bacterium]